MGVLYSLLGGSVNYLYMCVYICVFSVFAYRIIGLYLSFILLIGRALRMGTTGLPPQIMYIHLPYVDRVLALCLDFYMARECREFEIEEEIYAQILFLYRSPETRVKFTRRPLKFKED